MFGKKAKKIKELEGKIAHRDYTDLERYNPLAADIIKRVDAEAADHDSFTSVDLDTILAVTEQQYRGDKLLALFRELPPEMRLQLLLSVETDAEKAEMLQSALYEELHAVAAKNTLESLIEKAQTEKRIDLGALPKDLNVKFLLYDEEVFTEVSSPKKIKRNYYNDARLLTVTKGAGMFRLLSAKFTLDDNTTEILSKPSDLKLGTEVTSNGVRKLDTNVYFGAGLSLAHATEKAEIININDYITEGKKLLIGRIIINKEDIFIE